MHLPALHQAGIKEDEHVDEESIHGGLRLLYREYWGGSKKDTLDPEALWTAMKEHALFGVYDDEAMEDANTLLIDLLEGLPHSDKVFEARLQSKLNCSECHSRRSQAAWMLQRLFPRLPLPCVIRIVGVLLGEVGCMLESEKVLSLALTSSNVAETAGEADPDHGHDSLVAHMNLGCNGSGMAVEMSDLLAAYFDVTQLSDYKCDSCSNVGTVTKSFELVSCGPVLAIQLKRFAPVGPDAISKCHRPVVLSKQLDLNLFASENHQSNPDKERYIYRLHSVVCHDGGMGGGHYVAYVRHSMEDDPDWYWYSDQFYGPVSESQVLECEPYLVFYQRSLPLPPA
eukprot:TRINITY_DN4055_c0_g1_i1.p1 TRINITY_DN4055_c0_g1~~TRINITY_DN4055_c0_g1_i1.p1  ORF type:complete len:341 (-),score=57.84 TRINITY_DN4055_c0_g1_i1:453-1475(-)